MKVLFLDIDGVIATVGSECGFKLCFNREVADILLDKGNDSRKTLAELFDPSCLYYLRDIVKETGCKIVISSTWRKGATLEDMQSWFNCPVIKEAIIDKTPVFWSTERPDLMDRTGRVQRGEEIKDWLNRHPEVTRFAVLDDDSDMDVVRHSFFKTCTYDGLKRDVAHKVIIHLNNEDYLDHYRTNNDLNEYLAELRSCYGRVPNYKELEAKMIGIIKEMNKEYREL